MTTVKYSYDEKTLTYTVAASGHSGYAASGSDIVCASISTLIANLANQAQLYKDHGIIDDTVYTQRPARAVVIIRCGKCREGAEIVKIAVTSVISVINALQQQYPKNIKLLVSHG